MFRTAGRTAALTIAATGIAVLAGVGAASAHIETDPPSIEAGARTTLGFVVEHGCADANTTGLDIKMPDGVNDATATEDGWQVAVADGVVRFAGGNQDAHTSRTFHITFTAPTTVGTASFPTVQHCVGTDTSWLDVQAAGQAEPEHPAPMVNVTQGPPTSDELVIPTDTDDDAGTATTGAGTATTGSGTATTGASTATTEAGASTEVGSASTGGGGAVSTASTAPAVTLVPTVTAPARTTSSDDDSSAGVIVVIIVVVLGAALGIAGIVVTKRRRNATPPKT
jgi:uncharacterized protein YcnI